MYPKLKGSLTVIIGPMFSGKSTELQKRLRRYNHAPGVQSIVCVNSFKDTRYDVNASVTHDKGSYPALSVTNLSEVSVSDYDVIGVDEGHFFTSLVETDTWASQGKIVIVAALHADFKRDPFPEVTNLIAKADEVVWLTAICTLCGAPASNSKRLNTECTETIVVGGYKEYEPRCRGCQLSITYTSEEINMILSKMIDVNIPLHSITTLIDLGLAKGTKIDFLSHMTREDVRPDIFNMLLSQIPLEDACKLLAIKRIKRRVALPLIRRGMSPETVVKLYAESMTLDTTDFWSLVSSPDYDILSTVISDYLDCKKVRRYDIPSLNVILDAMMSISVHPLIKKIRSGTPPSEDDMRLLVESNCDSRELQCVTSEACRHNMPISFERLIIYATSSFMFHSILGECDAASVHRVFDILYNNNVSEERMKELVGYLVGDKPEYVIHSLLSKCRGLSKDILEETYFRGIVYVLNNFTVDKTMLYTSPIVSFVVDLAERLRENV